MSEPVHHHPHHAPHEHHSHEHVKKSWFSSTSNLVALAGFVVLGIIVLWGLIHLLSLSWGWFSGFVSSVRKNDSITLIAPMQVYSQEDFALTWKYSPKAPGNYAFIYECDKKVSFAIPVGQKGIDIPCGTAYTLGGATSSVALTPTLSATSSVDTALTLIFIPSSTTTVETSAQGATHLSVNPAKNPPKVATSKPQTTQAPATNPAVPSAYTAPADLAVHIVSASVDVYGNATVSFDIANVGGSPSGTYYFTAQLPTTQSYTYTSPAQASLSPGSHIVSTLNFTFAVPGNFVVSLSGGNDNNGANNFATQFINAPISNQYQNQPIYTPSQQPYYQPYYGNTYYNNGQPYYVNSGQVPYIVY